MDAQPSTDLAEVKHRCTACSQVVRLVYVPHGMATTATWKCPIRQCRAVQTLELRGRLIKAFAGTQIEQREFPD